MKNPYFNIKSPSNNIIWDYSFGEINRAEFLGKMRPKDLYKIIPLAFNSNRISGGFAVQLKQFIKECLKDPGNHKYLAVRCKYDDTPKDMPRRNNIIHGILTADNTVFYVGDIELMKEVISCAVAAGVSPFEHSIGMDMSPLGMVIESDSIKRQRVYSPELNKPVLEAEKDFLQFLINLNPQSMIGFGPNNQCILSGITNNDVSNCHRELHRVNLTIENLPPNAMETNLAWLEEGYQKTDAETAQIVRPILDGLRVKKEVMLLNDVLSATPPKRKEKVHKI